MQPSTQNRERAVAVRGRGEDSAGMQAHRRKKCGPESEALNNHAAGCAATPLLAAVREPRADRRWRRQTKKI